MPTVFGITLLQRPLCKGSQVFGKAGASVKKDDILAIFVATLRDSYESLFPDQAVYFACCLFSKLVLLGGYYYADVGKQLYQEMSTRAKYRRKRLLIPTLRHEVEQKNITAIHDFMQKISAHSDASFIVIGDNKGQHLFHLSSRRQSAPRW